MATAAARAADKLLREPALVIGSAPPDARDLDLLVRAGARDELAAALRADGFEDLAGMLVRLAECGCEAVELIPAEDWGLPAEELDALFGEGVPLAGHQRLLLPAPHHVLLILARRYVTDLRGVLDEKRRARVASATEADPGAWKTAAARAGAWGARDALERLRGAYEDGREPPLALRARRRLRRPRRGTLVTLSGLDGSGKSSQAEALQKALDVLGYDAVVVWTSLVAHPALGAAGEPVKRLLRRLRRVSPPSAAEGWAQPADAPSSDPGRALRQRSAVLTQVWATYVALVNAWWQARATTPQLARGRVVICDRWTLDSKVQMRYQYGAERGFGFQARLVRLLSPRPARAFLLDISAGEAVRRKPEYTLEQNERRRSLYLADHVRLGVDRLDGERPQDELCAEIARAVAKTLEK